MWIYGFVTLIVADWVITSLYCKMRKKKDERRRKGKREVDKEYIVKAHSFKSNILKYVDGYILYKSVFYQFIPSHRIRKFILKYQFGMDIHKTAMIYHGSEFRHPWNISIGEGSSIGDHVKIDGRNHVQIGKNVNIGSGAWIWTEQHDYNDPNFECNNKGGEVKVEDRVWISSRVTVLPGITLAEGSVMAAGAVITKKCDKYTLYGGCPARPIGKRNENLSYELAGNYLHFY